MFLTKVDDHGEEIWSKTYGNREFESGNDIEQIGEDFFITGTSDNSAFGSPVFVLKIDRDGKPL